MAKNQQTLFQKLTRLFKSGPIVKRKIRSLDTTVALPDPFKSSGTLLFQKSSSPTYSTISANAYNLSERMTRYQDFVEMEYCLHGDTLIAIPGGYKKIKDLASESNENLDKQFFVYAYDHNLHKIVPALAKQARLTRIDHAYTVTFDNGKQITGTHNHRLMKRDGTFCKIEDLKPNDAMMPFYRRDLFNSCKEEGDGYRWIYTMDKRSSLNGWVAEHCVIGEMLKGSTICDNEVVHHKNFIKYDNRPENLQVMTDKEHQQLHENILNGTKWSEQNSEWIKQFKLNHTKLVFENNYAKRKDITFGRILEISERVNFNSMKICEVLDTDINVINHKLLEHGYQNFETFVHAYNPDGYTSGCYSKGKNNSQYNSVITFDKICSVFSKNMSKKELSDSLGTTIEVLSKRLLENGYKSYAEFSQNYENLKVTSIEYHGIIPLYDLTVDGYKNFATDTVISHNTPEIASAMDIYADETCLSGDTIVPLADGSFPTIKQLYDEEKKDFHVYSYDIEKNEIVTGKATFVVKTGIKQLFKLTFVDESYIRLTDNHKVLTEDGQYICVKDLKLDDSVRALHIPVTSSDPNKNIDGCKKISAIVDDGIEDVFDLEVLEWHNFAASTRTLDGSYVFVHNCAQDEKGRILQVYSENEKIKEVLEELFYDVLNIEFNLRSWVRNLIKYGDFFLYCDVSPDHGVVNVFPIPVNEIIREENYDPDDPMAVRYKWVTIGNKSLENWEVIHFRLLGNDSFLPYGSSAIEAARRIWRQLTLIEDAMLVYRVVRAPERRVFYIDVANIPPENVPMYVEEQRKNLRSSQVIDRTTGRVDLRYNPLCHFGNDYIHLCDGTKKTFIELSENWELYKDNTWVWSLDKNNHVIPTRLLWAGKTIESTKFIEVELDDGQVIRTTSDHKWLTRDGAEIKAKDLQPGTSMMPFYTKTNHKLTYRHGDKHNKYIDIYDPSINKYVSAHRLSGLWKYDECKWPNVIHHVNHIKHDNRPENLVKMTQSEHAVLHNDLITAYNKSVKGRINSSVRMKKSWKEGKLNADMLVDLWKNENVRKNRVDSLTCNVDSRIIGHVGTAINVLGTSAREHQIRDYLNGSDDFKIYMTNLNPNFKNGFNDKLTKGSFLKILRKFNFENLRAMKDYVVSVQAPLDKITSVCLLNGFSKRKQIENHFCISKHDLTRTILKNGLTVKEFDTRFLGGGHYGKASCECNNCKKTYESNVRNLTTPNGRQFCSRDCYNAFRNINVIRKNHKIISVKMTDWEAPAYGVTVENSTHIIAIGGTGSKLINSNGIFLLNSVDEDYFIPVRGGESGTKIDTLAGGQNAAAVEDVAYIQKKLFSALKIPKAYLGYDESLSSKATLAQEDIRFSRTIGVIQKTIIAELNKIAIIHLYSHGFDDEDLQGFVLRLQNPSTIAQQQKLELWRSKFEIAGSAPEGHMSKEFIRKQIWGLSDEECKEIDDQRLKEKLVDAAIEGAKSEDEEAAPEEEAGGDEEAPDEAGGDEEEAEDLFAGDDSGEDESSNLLLAADDPDDDEEFGVKFNLKDLDMPIKAQRQIDRIRHNRARISHAGPAKLHMPDWKSSLDAKDLAMTDPFDSKFLRSLSSNPLKEIKTRIGSDVMSALRKMASTSAFKDKAARVNNLLSEDLSIELDDQESNNDEEEIL